VGKEHRRFKRAEIAIRIRLRESDTDIEASFALRDLSEGGLFVHSPILWEPGEKFELSFMLPGSDREIHATGEVARAEDKYLLFPDAPGQDPVPGMGIRFLDLSAGDRALIRDYLEGSPSA